MAGPNPHFELWKVIERMGPTECELLVQRLQKHDVVGLQKISTVVELASQTDNPDLALDAANAEIDKQPKAPPK